MKLSPKAKASLDNMVERFKAGNLGEICLVARIARDPADDCPMAHWSFRNIILAYAQTGDLDVRGYKQWAAIGRQVQKGSKAAYILAPCHVYEKDGKGKGAKPKLGPDGSKTVAYTYYKAIPVFGVSKTEGDALPVFDYSPPGMPPLMEVAERLGITVEWAPLPPDRLGSAKPDGSRVRVGTHDTATWFHELAHAVEAKVKGALKGGKNKGQEVTAEFCATVLMDLYGYRDHAANAWEYIAHYAKDPIEAIQKALGDVELILETVGA